MRGARLEPLTSQPKPALAGTATAAGLCCSGQPFQPFAVRPSVLGRKVVALGRPRPDAARVGTRSAYAGWKSNCY